MTFKYSSFRKFRHDHNRWNDEVYLHFKDPEIYGQKAEMHSNSSFNNRMVIMSKDYVLKIDTPSSKFSSILQQGHEEFTNYNKLTKTQKKYVPELIEAGELYIPYKKGYWLWYTVFERVKGETLASDTDISPALIERFKNITRDFHEFNVIKDRGGKQWLIDLGY